MKKGTSMVHQKRIALVAHDNKKHDLLEWAVYNHTFLVQHELYATGTTGALLEQALGVSIHKLKSGPLGGDQQIGAKIAEHELDLLIFFWDPLENHPHDSDVRALLRIAVVWNLPIACNRASADYMLTSPLMVEPYEALVPEYDRPSAAADAVGTVAAVAHESTVSVGKAHRAASSGEGESNDRRLIS